MARKLQHENLDHRIKVFEQRVGRCQEAFSIRTLENVLQRMDARLPCPQSHIHTVTLNEMKDWVGKWTKLSKQPKISFSEFETDFQYLVYFLNLMKYLRSLFSGFVTEILAVLKSEFDNQLKMVEADDQLDLSSASELSAFTTDSGFDTNSTLQQGLKEFQEKRPYGLEFSGRIPAFKSVSILFQEYPDLKILYDFSEQDKVHHRLRGLEENIEMLFIENRVSCDVYCPESLYNISADQKNRKFINVLRLIPDLSIKFWKAAWLAKKWCTLISNKPSDLKGTLKLAERIEYELYSRLQRVKLEYLNCEQRLESNLKQLNTRLVREERSSELSIQLFEVDSKIILQQTKLENSNKLRDNISTYIVTANKQKHPSAVKELRQRWAENRSQRLAIINEITLLKFQRRLLNEDLNIELNLKPSVVVLTNTSQDICDVTETRLTNLNEEKKRLTNALKFVTNNKKYLKTNLREVGRQDHQYIEPTISEHLSSPRLAGDEWDRSSSSFARQSTSSSSVSDDDGDDHTLSSNSHRQRLAVPDIQYSIW